VGKVFEKVIVHLQVDEHRYVEDKGEDGHRDNVQREMFEPPIEKKTFSGFSGIS
jgi:hypothetical protein